MSTDATPELFRRQVAMPMQTEAPLRTPLVLALRDDAFREALLKWTRRRTGHDEDAEDVLGVAMERAIRRERRGAAWDPNGGTTAGLYMIRLITGALKDRHKRNKRRPVQPIEDIEDVASEDTSPGQRVANRLEADERRRLANALHSDLVASGQDPVAVEILESISCGVTTHSAIAARTGRTLNEVIAGMKRLTRLGQATIHAFRQQARFQ